jgi:superfamily I DNA and/or RNA helicase
MDEASQIRPQDAIGTLLRAEQAIVVDDSKQLPPTDYFERALNDAEDDPDDQQGLSPDDKVDADSVLDLAAQVFEPGRRLRWHYRSKHESLIAFSNREFYDDSLIVFPSVAAKSPTLGIELVRIEGVWRDRTNAEEAQALVRRFAEFVRAHPHLSCGIVSMNQPQRDVLEEEVDRLIADDPDVAAYRDNWAKRRQSGGVGPT